MRKHADSTVYMTKKKFWSTSTPGTFADFLAADETAGELEESDHITIKRYTPDVLGREDPAAAEFLLMLVFDADPDPDPAQNLDPDPDPDPGPAKKYCKNLRKNLK